jgi:two-component system KDP operon response regulator KdpE
MKVAILDLCGCADALVLSLRIRWPELQTARLNKPDEVLGELSAMAPDLVVLGVSDGDVETADLIRTVKSNFSGAVVTVARDPSEAQEVDLLEAGADRYIPASARGVLFVARVSAALRAFGVSENREEPTLTCGNLVVRPATYEAYVDGELIPMTPTEFSLLRILAENAGRVVTQEALEDAIWGATDVFSRDCLRKYVARLRQKLHSADATADIVTVNRIGYRLVESV